MSISLCCLHSRRGWGSTVMLNKMMQGWGCLCRFVYLVLPACYHPYTYSFTLPFLHLIIADSNKICLSSSALMVTMILEEKTSITTLTLWWRFSASTSSRTLKNATTAETLLFSHKNWLSSGAWSMIGVAVLVMVILFMLVYYPFLNLYVYCLSHRSLP